MTLLQAALLGAVQGLTEFLPVSSSAHLRLAHWWFGLELPAGQELTFDVATHAGTVLALLIYFGREWLAMITRPELRPLGGLVLLACLPAALAGLLLESWAETRFRDPLQIALLLAAMGLLMALVDARGRKDRELSTLTLPQALAVGGAQALALMPGVSRSGITIVAGLGCGLTREAAARFSFLLSLPLTAGAVAYKLRHPGELAQAGLGGPILIAVLTSAVCGWIAIDRLLGYLRTRTLAPFAVYRVALALLVVVGVVWRGGG